MSDLTLKNLNEDTPVENESSRPPVILETSSRPNGSGGTSSSVAIITSDEGNHSEEVLQDKEDFTMPFARNDNIDCNTDSSENDSFLSEQIIIEKSHSETESSNIPPVATLPRKLTTRKSVQNVHQSPTGGSPPQKTQDDDTAAFDNRDELSTMELYAKRSFNDKDNELLEMLDDASAPPNKKQKESDMVEMCDTYTQELDAEDNKSTSNLAYRITQNADSFRMYVFNEEIDPISIGNFESKSNAELAFKRIKASYHEEGIGGLESNEVIEWIENNRVKFQKIGATSPHQLQSSRRIRLRFSTDMRQGRYRLDVYDAAANKIYLGTFTTNADTEKAKEFIESRFQQEGLQSLANGGFRDWCNKLRKAKLFQNGRQIDQGDFINGKEEDFIFQPGDNVMARWHKDGNEYPAKVTNRYPWKGPGNKYSIEFTGKLKGERRWNVPAKEITPNHEVKLVNSPSEDDVVLLTTQLNVGSRVYAFWPATSAWYWGCVSNRYQGHPDDNGFYRYSIKFDDGDFRKNVPRREVLSEEEYERFGPDAKWSDDSSSSSVDQSSNHSSVEESSPFLSENIPKLQKSLYSCEDDCLECENCLKNACGQCARCKGLEDGICFHKMCLKLDPKKLLAPGFPDGWSFYFRSKSSNCPNEPIPNYSGLVIQSPGGCRFKSIERAKNKVRSKLAGVDIHQFNTYVGIEGEPTRLSVEKKKKSFSNKIVVGARCYAKFYNGEWYWGRIQAIQGGGSCRKFTVLFDDGDIREGIPMYEIVNEGRYKVGEGKKPPETSNVAAHLFRENETKVFDEVFPHCTAAEPCKMCQRDDCERCKNCVDNASSTEPYRKTCLRKACARILGHDSKFPLEGFPVGWKWSICQQSTLPWKEPVHPILYGFCVESPTGEKFQSYEAAAEFMDLLPCIVRVKSDDFYKRNLGESPRQIVDHPLLGRFIRRRWVDVGGRYRSLTSRIIRSEVSLGGQAFFRIENSQCASKVLGDKPYLIMPPQYEEISDQIAWQGHLQYHPQSELTSDKSFYQQWIVPDSISHLENAVILSFRGCLITVKILESKVPGAGRGAFLLCESEMDSVNCNKLVLKPGELLDLGIYGPLRQEDMKTEVESLVKNYIFEHEPEAWSWDAVGHEKVKNVIDITDDRTGQLHLLSIKNPLSFVNEVSRDGETPTVHAFHDPEGGLHYLLGHSYDVQRDLVFLANGRWTEIKTDYGDRYEKIRCHKGYSQIPKVDQQPYFEDDDVSTLQNISAWCVNDIDESVVFLEHLFQKVCFPRIHSTAASRALHLSLEFLARLRDIIDSFIALDAEQSICDGGYSTMDQKNIINRTHLLTMDILEVLREDSKMKNVLLSHEAFHARLAIAFKQNSIHLNFDADGMLWSLSNENLCDGIEQLCNKLSLTES